MLNFHNIARGRIMDEKEFLDFDELDGQLGFVIQHLEKKDKKKAVSYYLKESTIERIKVYAQKYNMKDSQFLEEVVNKLIDVIEGQRNGQTSQQNDDKVNEPEQADQIEQSTSAEPLTSKEQQASKDQKTSIEQSTITTPWARLQSAKTAKQISEEVNRKEKASEVTGQDLPEANKTVTEEVIAKTNTKIAKITEENIKPAELTEAQLKAWEGQVIDYIFKNFKPDYRILYRRFEDKVRQSVQIDKEALYTITRRLDKNGDVTFFEKQNLLDINKKIFEERLPGGQDLARYYEDTDIID